VFEIPNWLIRSAQVAGSEVLILRLQKSDDLPLDLKVSGERREAVALISALRLN
jgi:hypothetical protein